MKLENRGLFTIEGYEKNFTAYSNPEQNWNGWACPYFKLEDALDVLETMEGVRFYEHKELEDGCKVICWLDDDNEMQILESEIFQTVSGDVELFGVGVCQWCWEGVNCDPTGPEEKEEEPVELLVEALVEGGNMENYAVTLKKNGLDSDWWTILDRASKEECEEIAGNINEAFKKFGLTK